jgi:restriction system protein
MPIPDYQSVMLPLLNQVADKKTYLFKDVVELLGHQFKLTEEDLKELLPSGKAFLFSNRVGWARTYLKKAGLIDSPKRGTLAITPRGLAVLKERPKKIDNALLRRFSEFVDFQSYCRMRINKHPKKQSKIHTRRFVSL